MASEAGAVIGVLFAIVAVAILYWLKVRYYDKRPFVEEETYGELGAKNDGNGQSKNKSKQTKPNNDISTLLFPVVSNPMMDMENGNMMDTENDDDYRGETFENVGTEGICKAGYLKKKSSGIRKDWLIRHFFIKDGRLYYVHESEELIGRKNVKARQVANLLISTVKEVSELEFQIISPGQRGATNGGGVYELQGDTSEDRNDWVRVIREQIEGALVSTLSSKSSADMSETASALFVPGGNIIAELKAMNPHCADCGAPAPEWASLNLCIMVCIACSGVHRKLGTHISKVRSITLDKWTYNSLQLLLTIGNERSNAVWEAMLSDAEEELESPLKPTKGTTMEERERYIVKKYVQREYVFARDATTSQKESHLIKSAADGDLVGVMAAIAAGADVNVRSVGNGEHVEDSKTALHLACIGQHTLCVELLCQMSASVDEMDAAGFTPLDIAIGMGYKDVADILRVAARSTHTPERSSPPFTSH